MEKNVCYEARLRQIVSEREEREDIPAKRRRASIDIDTREVSD